METGKKKNRKSDNTSQNKWVTEREEDKVAISFIEEQEDLGEKLLRTMWAPFQNPTKRQHILRKLCSPHKKMNPIKIAPKNPRIMGHCCAPHQLSLGTAACRERIDLGTNHLCKGRAARPMYTGLGVKYKLILFIWTRPEAAVGYNKIVMERNAQPEILSHKI